MLLPIPHRFVHRVTFFRREVTFFEFLNGKLPVRTDTNSHLPWRRVTQLHTTMPKVNRNADVEGRTMRREQNNADDPDDRDGWIYPDTLSKPGKSYAPDMLKFSTHPLSLNLENHMHRTC